MARRFPSALALAALLLMPMVARAQTAADCDFDGSRTVDFLDFVQLADVYNTADPTCDIDRDGVVGFSDFLVFAQFFGQSVTNYRPLANAGADQGVEKKNTIVSSARPSSRERMGKRSTRSA